MEWRVVTSARMAVAEMSRAVMRCKLTPRPDAWRIVPLPGSYRKESAPATRRSPIDSVFGQGGRVMITRSQSDRMVSGSRQVWNSSKASRPRMSAIRTSGPTSARRARTVSTEYDGPLRPSSTPQGRKPAQPATASSTMRRRWGAGVTPSTSLCGGTAAGTKRTSSSPSASRTSSAARRCPRWIGSNVPPRMPMPPLRCSVPDLAGAAHQVLVGRQLAQTHRSACVQPVGADPDLGAEAELEAVGEAGGGVDEHRGRVDALEEARGGAVVLGDDGFGQLRAVRLDECERVVERRDDVDARMRSRYSVSQSASVAGVTSGTIRRAASSARTSQPCARSAATMRGRNRGATRSWTTRFSMALQTLGRCTLAFRQRRSAMSRSAAASTYRWQMPSKCFTTGMRLSSMMVRFSVSPPRAMTTSMRSSRRSSPRTTSRPPLTSCTAAGGRPAASTAARIASAIAPLVACDSEPLFRSTALRGLQAERRGVRRDVGARLVDREHDPDRHPHLGDLEPVRTPPRGDRSRRRVGQCGDLLDPSRHGLDARRGKREPVDERRRVAVRAARASTSSAFAASSAACALRIRAAASRSARSRTAEDEPASARAASRASRESASTARSTSGERAACMVEH